MQPSGTRSTPIPGATRPSAFSLVDSLDSIKHGFDSLQSELTATRLQRDELETKITTQLVEVSSIRQSLFELETRHKQVCHQYEQEIRRLQEELRLSRGDSPAAVRGPSSRGLGKTDPPVAPSGTSTADSHTRNSHPLDSSRLAIEREPLTVENDFHNKSMRSEGDRDREYDQRNPKRRKGSDQAENQMMARHLLPEASSSKSSSSHSSFNSQHTADLTPGHSTRNLPPLHLHPNPPSTPRPALDLHNVPAECVKEGPDWYALFSPQIKRTLDVHLLHTLHHTGVVCSIRFSSDGKFVATGSNRIAQIFDVQTGATICSLQDDTAPKTADLYIRCVRFSPDGKFLATGAEDSKIRVWDVAKKRIIHVLEGHQQEIYSVDFSRDGQFIASGSGDGTVRVWKMRDQSCKTFVISEEDALTNEAGVTSVSISPDGRLVAAGNLDSAVRIWDVSSGKLVERLRGHSMSVYSVAFMPDGRGLLSASLDKQVKLWDVSRTIGALYRGQDLEVTSSGDGPSTATSFVGHKDFVPTVAISSDGHWIASGSKDRSVHFWDSHTGLSQFLLQGHKNSVISTDFNPLGGMFATGSGDYSARIWAYSTINSL
ncbi:WD40-repeat-containing domain protein [Crepidotus variabilis]|uniref:WD40-repeat-containing domain protein n=1 Tax=Crepidotus variabilis TaxID=179855 RepID=A0A9P6JPL6_9AGAR|nr:WD40-repeat-containing domain protein [Crepidotus variabilis]